MGTLPWEVNCPWPAVGVARRTDQRRRPSVRPIAPPRSFLLAIPARP